MSSKNSKIVAHDGPPCKRCGEPTDVVEHNSITTKLRSQAVYYTRWFCCQNEACQTKQIMDPRFAVKTGAHRKRKKRDDSLGKRIRQLEAEVARLSENMQQQGRDARDDPPPWE